MCAMQENFSLLKCKTKNMNMHIFNNNRAVLAYAPGLEHIISFLTQFKIGMIAIPACPPNRNKKESIASFAKISSETRTHNINSQCIFGSAFNILQTMISAINNN